MSRLAVRDCNGMAFKGVPHLSSVAGRDCLEAIAGQVVDQQTADFRIVVDDKDTVGNKVRGAVDTAIRTSQKEYSR